MRIWVVMLVAACAHAGGGGNAGFSIAYPASTGKVGAKLYAQPTAQCRYDNGRDARWATTGAHVVSGELPPGVSIEDGVLTGKPTKAGSYTARIAFSGVTCAGKA
ncbi:MAG: putative Ig domain-containing protein, partial [Deltaproteobacteria bacterium]|nr:putative Ig domain-containing protein [Deltaproteobacteria bacterium]